MTELIIKLVCGCLNCDYPIPMKEARKGKMLCSKKCLIEINKLGGHYDMGNVMKKRRR